MKSFLVAFICLILVNRNVIAQSPEAAAVGKASAALNKAIIDGNKPVLESLTAPELSYGHSGGKVETQSQFVTALATGAVDFSSIDITEETIQVSGNNAVIRNKFHGILTNDGKPLELTIGILQVWKKEKGNWILIARQGYKL